MQFKYFSEKVTSFSKTALLQREPFLKMFYILSTALHCSLPVTSFYANNYFDEAAASSSAAKLVFVGELSAFPNSDESLIFLM